MTRTERSTEPVRISAVCAAGTPLGAPITTVQHIHLRHGLIWTRYDAVVPGGFRVPVLAGGRSTHLRFTSCATGMDTTVPLRTPTLYPAGGEIYVGHDMSFSGRFVPLLAERWHDRRPDCCQITIPAKESL